MSSLETAKKNNVHFSQYCTRNITLVWTFSLHIMSVYYRVAMPVSSRSTINWYEYWSQFLKAKLHGHHSITNHKHLSSATKLAYTSTYLYCTVYVVDTIILYTHRAGTRANGKVLYQACMVMLRVVVMVLVHYSTCIKIISYTVHLIYLESYIMGLYYFLVCF